MERKKIKLQRNHGYAQRKESVEKLHQRPDLIPGHYP